MCGLKIAFVALALAARSPSVRRTHPGLLRYRRVRLEVEWTPDAGGSGKLGRVAGSVDGKDLYIAVSATRSGRFAVLSSAAMRRGARSAALSGQRAYSLLAGSKPPDGLLPGWATLG